MRRVSASTNILILLTKGKCEVIYVHKSFYGISKINKPLRSLINSRHFHYSALTQMINSLWFKATFQSNCIIGELSSLYYMGFNNVFEKLKGNRP